MSTAAPGYLTIPEAAGLLRVSVFTIRRWIRDGTIQAHRVGRRRLLLRREDVTRSMRAVAPEPEPVSIPRVTRPQAAFYPHLPYRLTAAERERGLRAMEKLEALAANDRARLEESGIMTPESWEDIREAREFCTEQLMGEDDSEFDQFDIGVLAHMIIHSPDRPRRRLLTLDEQRSRLAALERSKRTRERIRRRSGVEKFPPSEDIIAEMREERMRQLLGEDDSQGAPAT